MPDYPSDMLATLNRAIASHRAGNLTEAERLYKLVLSADEKQFEALHYLGVLEFQRGRHKNARRLIASALQIDRTRAEVFSNYARVLNGMGRYEDALASCNEALAIKPDFLEVLTHRGNSLRALKRPEEALASYEKALEIKPDYVVALTNRGNVLNDLMRRDEALACYEQALKVKPDHAEALNGRGVVLNALKRYEEALASYDRALAVRPHYDEALTNRGATLNEQKRYEEALASYDQALRIKPDSAEALYNRGVTFFELRRYDEALASYDKTLAIRPDLVVAIHNRGETLMQLGRYGEAVDSFRAVTQIDPNHKFASGHLVHSRMQVCDWSGLDDDIDHLLSDVRAGKCAAVPFVLIATEASPADQLRCSQIYIADRVSARSEPGWHGRKYRHDRIRIAYVSADFREHPMSFLMADLFERHDRARFETFAISLSPDEPSEMRARLKRAFQQFIDVDRKSDQDVADLLRALEIDIAVDLMGHTRNGRPNIFALRAAPIQVSYLGYPGSMGGEFMDYIIADKIALPFDQQPFYAERIVHLPDCFIPVGSQGAAIRPVAARREMGLPERAFVFCCFNENYKVGAPVFDIWMRLLGAVDGSVLWLMRSNDSVVASLRREAQARGVDPARLIFAPRVKFEDHLARISLADLLLNTHPVNAGATAIDALSVGLPVLTYAGSTLVSRVTASLLHAVGLPELVTHSFGDYEALALKIAAEPSLLQAMRRKLVENRSRHPLFDVDRSRRHLEAAYTTMWEIGQRAESPRSFAV